MPAAPSTSPGAASKEATKLSGGLVDEGLRIPEAGLGLAEAAAELGVLLADRRDIRDRLLHPVLEGPDLLQGQHGPRP